MKKLMLISGCLLSSFELMAGNFVPVCLNVREERKAKVYQAIVDNSFVTQLDPARSSGLSSADKNEIINDESGFLRKKIKSADPSADVAFIPKSLYQLFIENCCFDDLRLILKGDEDEDEFIHAIFHSAWSYISHKGLISFGFSHDVPESISDFCNNYMNNENVKSYFWKINDSIIPFFDEISAEQVSDSKNLEKITKRLFNNISPSAKTIFDLDRRSGLFWRHRLMDYTRLLTKVDTEGTVMGVDLENDFVKTIVDLVVEEGKTPENIYRIYRGEGSSGPNRKSAISYSFSDGMFGGIVRDFDTGMAFNHAISAKHMKIVDLPKEELLNVEANSNGIETSGLSVLIPPIFSMGAALGGGEFHHVRTKIKIDPSKKMEDNKTSYDQGIGGEVSASLMKTPWLYSYTSPIENFWNRCELVAKKSYNISNSKVLNIETYKLSSGEEKQSKPSSSCLIL